MLDLHAMHWCDRWAASPESGVARAAATAAAASGARRSCCGPPGLPSRRSQRPSAPFWRLGAVGGAGRGGQERGVDAPVLLGLPQQAAPTATCSAGPECTAGRNCARAARRVQRWTDGAL